MELSHDKVKPKFSYIVDFNFKGRDKIFIGLSNKATVCWGKEAKGENSFSKASVKIVVNYLIESCLFDVGNTILKELIDIPMGIDYAPFWANLFLYSCNEEYMLSLISSDEITLRHFQSIKHFKNY